MFSLIPRSISSLSDQFDSFDSRLSTTSARFHTTLSKIGGSFYIYNSELRLMFIGLKQVRMSIGT